MQYLEIAARVAVIYVALMVLLRVSGRREMSEMGPMDLLTMLLLSEVVSPALTGGDESVPGGLIAAATLIGMAMLTGFIAFRSKRAEKVINGEAVVLIRKGKVERDVLHKFRITDDDLREALHHHGLLRMDQVERAYVEADGEITMIKRESTAGAS